METITVLVPAAGCGARAALNGNKILAPLLGRPLLSWTLQALWQINPTEMVVACKNEERAAIRDAFDTMGKALLASAMQTGQPPPIALDFIEEAPEQERNASSKPIVLVEGGATRQDSVLHAVRAARGAWILVHDAARPCVSQNLIEATLAAARQSGAAIAALPVSDTVKRAAPDGSIAATLDRREIWLAQTPQIFRREPFLAALEAANREGWQGTDCASIMERAGHCVALVAGDADNLKVTYAADLHRAATILTR